MTLIGRYVVRQALRPFLFIIALALFLLLIERMLRLLDQVLGFGGSPLLLMEMLAFLVPHYMALALPAGFFLGVLLAFSGLNQRSELDALNAAGIGLLRLLRPILVLALLLALLSALNASYAQPYARYIYRSLVHFIAETSILGFLQERTAVEVGDYTFLADHERRGSRDFGRIFIYEEQRGGASITTTAERARLRSALEDNRLVLSLANGVRVSTTSGAATGAPAEDIRFEEVEYPIRLDGRTVFRDRGNDERELTFLELWRQRDTPPRGATSAQMLAELNDHLVRAISMLFLPLLAIGIAVGSRRSPAAYRIGLGVLTVIAYNEILNIGKVTAGDAQMPPLAVQWTPFLLFAAGSVWLFYRTALRVPVAGATSGWLDWLDRVDRGGRRALARLLAGRRA